MLYRRSFDEPPISKEEAAEAGQLFTATFDEMYQGDDADALLGKDALQAWFEPPEAQTKFSERVATASASYKMEQQMGLNNLPVGVDEITRLGALIRDGIIL